MATEKQIAANRKNAQKSTGPKSVEGKAIASMNGVKHGKYITKFNRIHGEQAGNLATCEPCGEDQQNACRVAKTCMLWDELAVAYIKTHETKDPRHIENINIVQLTTMDFIFNQRLRYAQQHLGDTEPSYDKDGKVVGEKMVIDTQYLYTLMNMAKSLSKSLPDMQLTRQTQENIDVEWAQLIKAEISPERAAEAKEKIINQMTEWRKSAKAGDHAAELDEAINEFRQKEDKGEDEDFTIGDIGDGPFSNGK